MDRTLRLQVIFNLLERATGPLRSIFGGSRAAARGLAETRRELRGLQDAQSRIRGLRDLQRGLTDTYSKLDAARRRVRELKTEIASTDNPTKRLTDRLKAAERAAAGLGDKTQDQARRLRELQAELSAAGVDVGDLARHEGDLSRQIEDATRRLERQREELERTGRARRDMERMQQRGEQMRRTGRDMIGAGVVLGAPLVAAGISAANFETTLTDIAQKADLTRRQVAAIGREFDRMGPRVAQLPANLAAGVDTLVGLGAAVPQAMQAIEPIARAATAYRAEIPDLANATYASLSNLQVQARDTGRTLDIMAQAGKAGAFEMRDMAQYFPALTASFNALGQRGVPAVADLAAALQITRRGAGDSASAANNLQNLLNKINTRDTIQNFRAMGVDIQRALREGAQQGRSPIETIVEQTIRATRGDLSRLSFLFGDAQVQAALRPLVQNLGDYRRIRAEALRAQNTVEADFAERLRDTEQQYARNMARLQQLAHVVGAALLPAFNRVMESVGRVAERFAGWAQRNPELVATLAKIAAVTSIVLIATGSLAFAIGSLLGPFALLRFTSIMAWQRLRLLGTGIAWLSCTVAAAGAGMLANPVVLAITAIVVAIALLGYVIYRNWDRIRPVLAAIWAKLAQVFGGPLARLFAAASSAFSRFGALLGQILRPIGAAIGFLMGKLTALWQGPFGRGVMFVLGLLGRFGMAVATVFGTLLVRVLIGAVEALAGIFNAIGNIVDTVSALLRGDFAGVWRGLKNLVSGIVGSVLNILEALFPGIRGIFSRGIAWLGGAWGTIKGLFVRGARWLTAPVRMQAAQLQAVWNWLRSMFAGVGGWLGGAWGTIRGLFVRGARWLTAPVRMQAAQLEAVWDWLRSMFAGVGAWLGGAWQTIKGHFVRGALWLTAPVRLQAAGLQAVWNWLRSMFAGVGAWMSTAWATIRNLTTRGALALTAPLRAGAAAVRAVWDQIKAAFNSAVSFLASLPSRFYSFGSNIINGLKNGLLAPLRALRDTVTGIGRQITGWFRNTLGIRSPSRVFAELGRFITEGLSIGIDRGGRGPVARMRAVARELAAAASFTVAAPAIAGAAQPAAAVLPAPVQALSRSSPALVRPAGGREPFARIEADRVRLAEALQRGARPTTSLPPAGPAARRQPPAPAPLGPITI